MRLLPVFLMAILPFCSCSNKKTPQDCNRFRNGKFDLSARSAGEHQVNRQGTSQIEYHADIDSSFGFKVTWTSDCTYELRKEFTAKGKYPNSFEGWTIYTNVKPIMVRIIETSQQYYICEYSNNGMISGDKDTMFVVTGFRTIEDVLKDPD